MTTRRAASYALEATLADAPVAVTEAIRTRILDTLAATATGYRLEALLAEPDRPVGEVLDTFA